MIKAVTAFGMLAFLAAGQDFRPQVPKTWDEAALKDWATPVAGLNMRPTHMTEREYYALPLRDSESYPVYFPGQEPEGYWERLPKLPPKRLVEWEMLKTEADWIEAGRRVFHNAARSFTVVRDREVIAAARNAETYAGRRMHPSKTVLGVAWLPEKEGVALTLAGTCGSCHHQSATGVSGAPGAVGPGGQPFAWAGDLRDRMQDPRVLDGGGPFFMEGPIGLKLFQAYAVPWNADSNPEAWKGVEEKEWLILRTAVRRSGGTPRWNGSLHYPAKTPDLIGIKDRKYIDATATHLHRGIGDLMRYAALILSAETVDFGPHHMLSGGTKRVQARFSDEALYALALYIYSLQPPPNPNPFDEKAQAGQKLFVREGCVNCHTPPLYTNNKLTLAEGFKAPPDKPSSLDVLPISVGTDSGLALKTRKGTGYYKIPSLKGVWYRGRYLHDGSVASLEEMFNPDRLKDTHVPGGFMPAGRKRWAIKGHVFGLTLDSSEREQLIAFLKTL